MYAVRVPLESTDQTVEHEVYLTAVHNLMDYLNIDIVQFNLENDSDDTSVRYKNRKGNVVSDSTPRTSFLKVTSSEEIDDSNAVSLRYLTPDQKPFYQDTEIDANFNTLYQPKKMILSMQYHVKSRSAINSIVNRMRTMESHSGGYNNIDIKYYYAVPMFLLKLLVEINTLKNTQREIEMTTDEYVTETFDTRADMLNPSDGNSNYQQLVIRETQQDALGYITTDLHNIKHEKDDDLGTYFIDFEYVIEYKLPLQVAAYYPGIVYNMKINKSFYKFIEQKPTHEEGIWTNSEKALMGITNDKAVNAITLGKYDSYLTYPINDKIRLPKPRPKLVRLLTVLVRVDPDNPTTLINLNDIPNITFKDEILNLFKNSEYPYIGELYKSIFFIELYKGDTCDYANKIHMDADLNLTTELPMEMTSTYRIVINAMVDLSYLNIDDYRRIRNYAAEEDIINETESNVPFFYRFATAFTLRDIDQTYNGVEIMDILVNRKDVNWQNYYTVMEQYSTIALFKV